MRTRNIQTTSDIPVMVLLAAMACTGSCKSGEPVAMTCPPGMAPAAGQRVCVEGSCGNGVLDEYEECDDGNVIDGDGCSSDCQSNEVCGNALVDWAVGEICDDGNTSSGDECCGDCRSCPELAEPRGTEAVAMDIEPMMPMAAEEAPCPSMVADLPASPRLPPEPLVIRSRVPAPLLEASRLESSKEPLPPWVMRALDDARAEVQRVQQRLRSEVRARRRLLQAQGVMNEELLRAHDMLAQIEQINADLHQVIASDCQRLPSGRGMALQ